MQFTEFKTNNNLKYITLYSLGIQDSIIPKVSLWSKSLRNQLP